MLPSHRKGSRRIRLPTNAGEILYRAIREISDTWDGDCSLPEHCAASMGVAHFQRAMRSMAGEIGSAIQQVHELRDRPFEMWTPS